ncbi:hypothetical protein M5K25_005180 [Dendrobium thyrsiflorum]|uniref:Secreted protein n=1 Tax=Dendrobium thyrsiflorum TaxID=117978 RepID=A0ABD0VHY7_DENTH
MDFRFLLLALRFLQLAVRFSLLAPRFSCCRFSISQLALGFPPALRFLQLLAARFRLLANSYKGVLTSHYVGYLFEFYWLLGSVNGSKENGCVGRQDGTTQGRHGGKTFGRGMKALIH